MHGAISCEIPVKFQNLLCDSFSWNLQTFLDIVRTPLAPTLTDIPALASSSPIAAANRCLAKDCVTFSSCGDVRCLSPLEAGLLHHVSHSRGYKRTAARIRRQYDLIRQTESS